MVKIFTESTELYISLCCREMEEHVPEQRVESAARKSSFFIFFSPGLFKLGKDPKGTQTCNLQQRNCYRPQDKA